MKCFLSIGLLLLLSSCTQPMDPVVESVNETKTLLQSYNWQLIDYQVTVKNTDIPPPVFLNSNDSLIQAGNYNINDMISGGTYFPVYFMQFTEDSKILVDSTDSGNYVDYGGSYFVFNNTSIRLKPNKAEKGIYNYFYNSQDQTMSFTLTEEDANISIERVTNRLTKWVINETPNEIGDAVANYLYSNTALQEKIHDFVEQAIAGKISEITDFNPETVANTLASEIKASLDSVDWETKLTDGINTELQKITAINADSLAPIMSENIATKIQAKFTVDEIYTTVLPYMEALDSQDPDTMANQIATLIVGKLEDIFDEENLQKIITPIWEEFTALSDTEVTSIASQLTGIVEDNWINTTQLSAIFLPFCEQIDSTPIPGMSQLAKEATDSLETFITNLNAQFPDLNLSPDYDQIQTVIKGIFVAAKPVINQNGPENVANTIAQTILDNFLTTNNIETAFETAINYLQSINPDVAAATIAEWLVAIEDKVAPEVIAKLTDKLSPILQNFDPDYAAFNIAQKVNAVTDNLFSVSNIERIVLPLLTKITEVNTEAVANIIAKAILNSSIVEESFSEENIAALLTPVLTNIHNINPDDLAEQITDALGSAVKNVFTEERVSKIISFLLYKEAWNAFKIANNFQEATIIISHE